ncbi:DUF1360 domain-containing protein [Danxiaibacter flavus]|uniref:DUF1360 domain-containing protein n=1 Tax=Danxiaibacter flavus TaxID=3049108 RepID=A0ABV3ZMQ7_9BACT|nr:DUF1360 domain-containing protein [Chitinophagaceae bacterium DXS]
MTICLYFLASILATWRLAHLLSDEDGPLNIVFMLREKAGSGFWGSLISCFYCVSIWIAAPFGIWMGTTTIEKIVFWIAVSGGACILYKLTGENKKQVHIPYYEEEKARDEFGI